MMHDSLWKELEADAQKITGDGIIKRLLSPNAPCTMFLGVQRPSLNRLFMLQVPRNILPSREQIPESKGFELTVQVTGEEPETYATLILSSTDRLYNEFFSTIAENLYAGLRDCPDQQKIVRNFLERLAHWQRFFEKNGVNGLSEEAQQGLFGELCFLKEHLLSTPESFENAISAWTGSKKRQHDFQFGNIAVEVKTSRAKQHQKLFISSEQQLDEKLVGKLFVYHISLSLIENNVDTLPALVTKVKDIIYKNHVAATGFEDCLLERGYLSAQTWRYQRTGYAIRENNVFLVKEGFPRLTERNLPPGVGDLSYTVSVAECKKFSVTVEELVSQIKGTEHE